MATFKSSLVSLTKTTIGAGLLAIPFAFKAQGIVLGFFLLLFAAIAAAYGLHIIAKVSIENLPKGQSSFFHLCSITYPRLSLLFDFSVFIQTFGVALSYLVLVGDLVPGLIGGLLTRNEVIVLSTVVIIPLVCLKKLDSLKIGSLIGLFAIFYLCLLVIFHAIFDDISLTQGNLKIWTFGNWEEIASSFSIIIFAYTAAQNICSITNEIEISSQMDAVISLAIGISWLLFSIVGLTGYIQFGDNVLGNIILNYNPDLLSTKIGVFALVLMVTLSLPLMFHPCRISFNNMIFWIENEFKSNNNNTNISNTSSSSITSDLENLPLLSDPNQNEAVVIVPSSNLRFFINTTILAIALYGLALSISSFEFVLAMVGATGSTLICFILPGLFGFKLFKSKRDKILSLSLTIWGTAVMIISVYATLYF